jgi:hypothetical protein
VLARWCMPPLGVNISSSSAAATAPEPAVPILPAAQTAALAMVSHLSPPLDLGPGLIQEASGTGGSLVSSAYVTAQGQTQPPTGFPQVQVSNVAINAIFCIWFCCECAVCVNRQLLRGFKSLLYCAQNASSAGGRTTLSIAPPVPPSYPYTGSSYSDVVSAVNGHVHGYGETPQQLPPWSLYHTVAPVSIVPVPSSSSGAGELPGVFCRSCFACHDSCVQGCHVRSRV